MPRGAARESSFTCSRRGTGLQTRVPLVSPASFPSLPSVVPLTTASPHGAPRLLPESLALGGTTCFRRGLLPLAMKRFLPLLLALAALLSPLAGLAAGGAAESMSERELKRILQRQQTILDAAQAAGENLDRSNTELQLSEIVRDYESLLRKDPKFLSTYIAYGLFLNSTGNQKRSYDIFKRAEAIGPDVAVMVGSGTAILAHHAATTGRRAA